MPEPRETQSEERAGERRGARAPEPAQAAEPRSFDERRAADGGVAEASRAGRTLAEGGRQIAEQGRRAGREMADAWRQAFDPLLALQYDMGRFMDDLWRQTLGFRAHPSAHALRGLGAASLFGLPPADLKETDQAHVLSVELRGLSRGDVEVSLSGDTIVVCGHKAEESQDVSATYRVSERRFGRFERAFPLPADVERDRIEARFQDGVLKITLPRSEAAAPQRAKIQVK